MWLDKIEQRQIIILALYTDIYTILCHTENWHNFYLSSIAVVFLFLFSIWTAIYGYYIYWRYIQTHYVHGIKTTKTYFKMSFLHISLSIFFIHFFDTLLFYFLFTFIFLFQCEASDGGLWIRARWSILRRMEYPWHVTRSWMNVFSERIRIFFSFRQPFNMSSQNPYICDSILHFIFFFFLELHFSIMLWSSYAQLCINIIIVPQNVAHEVRSVFQWNCPSSRRFIRCLSVIWLMIFRKEWDWMTEEHHYGEK